MKELLSLYARYNSWANTKIIDTSCILSNEKQHAAIVSSYDSIYKTFYHILESENVWLQRLNKLPYTALVNIFNGSLNSLAERLKMLDKQWEVWVEALDEQRIREVISYVNMKGNAYSLEVYKLLLHIFNHSTHHRGQIITMLRQSGITTIPITDFSGWVANV